MTFNSLQYHKNSCHSHMVINFFMILTSWKTMCDLPIAWLLSTVEQNGTNIMKKFYVIPFPPSIPKYPPYVHWNDKCHHLFLSLLLWQPTIILTPIINRAHNTTTTTLSLSPNTTHLLSLIQAFASIPLLLPSTIHCSHGITWSCRWAHPVHLHILDNITPTITAAWLSEAHQGAIFATSDQGIMAKV